MLEKIKTILSKIKNFGSICKKTKNSIEEHLVGTYNYCFDTLDDSQIEICIGEDIAKYTDDIFLIFQEVREEIKTDTNFVFPQITCSKDSSCQENEIRINLAGKEIKNIFIIPTLEYIRDEIRTLLFELFDNNLNEIFTCDLVEKYVLYVHNKNSYLIWNITNTLAVTDIRTILLTILKKKKSLKNISYIFEKIGETLRNNKYLYEENAKEIAKKVLYEL